MTTYPPVTLRGRPIDMRFSDAGIDFLKTWESCRLRAYQDQGGKWTIAWGHTLGVMPGEVIDQAQADRLLWGDLGPVHTCLASAVKVALAQCEYDALTDLVYNIGLEGFERSSLLKTLNAGDYARVTSEFYAWRFVDKVENKGLARRRMAESRVWRGGSYT